MIVWDVSLCCYCFHNFFVKVGIQEFVELFLYDPNGLKSFAVMRRLMSDDEMGSGKYLVGPKTHNRILSHTEEIFKMLDQVVHEVSQCAIIVNSALFSLKLYN